MLTEKVRVLQNSRSDDWQAILSARSSDEAVTSSFDAFDYETVYWYDKDSRLLSTTDPAGHINSQTYDDIGNTATKTDGVGNVTEYTYDEFGNLTAVDAEEGESTAYAYDLCGNTLSVTDSGDNTKYYEYNCANLLTKEIDVGGKTVVNDVTTYTDTKVEYSFYYPNGLLKLVNDRNSNALTGQVIGGSTSFGTHYVYDIHGRLLTKTAVGTGGTEAETEYTYDANGNVLTMEDGTGTTTRTYDSLNRMITKAVPNVGILSYTYDQTDGLTTGFSAVTSTDPKGNITKKVYDNAGRLKEVVANLQTTVYTYNDNGSVAEVEYGSGVKEQYTYYTNGLLQTLTNKRDDNSVISSYSYIRSRE